MTDMATVITDLAAETEAVVALVADLDPAAWATLTPAEGWTVTDQIGHLAYFDDKATLSATDAAGFAREMEADLSALDADIAVLHRRFGHDGPATLVWWRTARTRMLEAFSGIDPDVRLPWYGPPMRARSALVARLMETWAHGTDVADALAARITPTDRLFHIADLGVRTFSWSFANRGLEVPGERARVELTSPSGAVKVWNEGAEDSIVGEVEDFCLVVTQRRHLDDTGLVVTGATARAWMEVAQVFAGPPGPGRPPSS